jgi:hypothetical protein
LKIHPDIFEATYQPPKPAVSFDHCTVVPTSHNHLQEKRKAPEESPDERPAKRASTQLGYSTQSAPQSLTAKRKATDELPDERPTKKSSLVEAVHSGQTSTPVRMTICIAVCLSLSTIQIPEAMPSSVSLPLDVLLMIADVADDSTLHGLTTISRKICDFLAPKYFEHCDLHLSPGSTVGITTLQQIVALLVWRRSNHFKMLD